MMRHLPAFTIVTLVFTSLALTALALAYFTFPSLAMVAAPPDAVAPPDAPIAVVPTVPASVATVAPNVPAPGSTTRAPSFSGQARSQLPNSENKPHVVRQVPVYSAFDFLSGYMQNLTAPIILDATPWDNSSTNFAEYQKPAGGTTYWDYWPDTEPWDSPNHAWHDERGQWHTYSTKVIRDASGHDVTGYVLADRSGPGVMDKLWFTHDAVRAVFGVLAIGDPRELSEWGNLASLGKLRIQVDNRIVFDGPIENWFSGQAQQLSPALADALVWHYRQFGSDGNIIPIPYGEHLQVLVYGGIAKPKWFMATGVTLPAGTKIKSYTGVLALDQPAGFASNLQNPENYIQTLANNETFTWQVQSTTPTMLQLPASGTVGAIQFKIPKSYDPRALQFTVHYGDQVGIDVPLVAFFGEPGHVSLHHSTPVGIVEQGNAYLFYSNFPLPYQNGMTIQLSSASATPIPVEVRIATLRGTYNTQLRIEYGKSQKLAAYGPDYRLDVNGNGKLAGLVLVTQDQQLANVPRVRTNGKNEDADKRVWPMGYLEGNLTLTDGAGNVRYYSGQEDWAEGGFYFNLGFSTTLGGSNRPFGGILRYKQADDGYATLFRYFNDLAGFRFKNGLHLTFGHGTWNNNFPVTYQAIAFYYVEIPGLAGPVLPASEYTTIQLQDGQLP